MSTLHIYDLPPEILSLIQTHIPSKEIPNVKLAIRFPKLSIQEKTNRILEIITQNIYDIFKNIKIYNSILWSRLTELYTLVTIPNIIWSGQKKVIEQTTGLFGTKREYIQNIDVQPLTPNFNVYVKLLLDDSLSNYISCYAVLPPKYNPFPLKQWISVCLRDKHKIIVWGKSMFKVTPGQNDLSEDEVQRFEQSNIYITPSGDTYVKLPVKHFILLMELISAKTP